ncbi:MAG: hypothetical protein U1G07_21165 [Verrucomicrobiota bacterium]
MTRAILRHQTLAAVICALWVTTWGSVSVGQELFTEQADVAPAEVDRIYVRGLRCFVPNPKP